MNRLNKIVISFVLPFFVLLFNVAYAIEFGATSVANAGSASKTKVSEDTEISGYTVTYIQETIENYIQNQNDDFYYQQYINIISELKKAGYYTLITEYNSEFDAYIFNNLDVGFKSGSYNNFIYYSVIDSSITSSLYHMPLYSSKQIYICTNLSYDKAVPFGFYGNLFYSNRTIKVLAYSGGILWDGTSYYYEAPFTEPEEPDTPSLPSNAEITQAVQAFYNSDYYKNNKDFEDFIVMYNYETKYFDFIGHNFGNKLGQQIIDAGISIGYPPVSYNERWWKYTLPDEFLTTLFNKYYWLYSTNDFGENIKYEGKGSINDLLDLHFATSSIIVYSTTDYPVNTVLKNENDEMESTVELMPGDQYTYDENLDPTTNEYDPLTNFIPTNPTQNILGDVDFNEINKVFEENKDILNIKNASWLFTANNQLVNYFIGFLSFLIVLIIISRLLGG